MNAVAERPESLAAVWANFEQLNSLITQYLKTSEDEFGALIQALGECWNMAENVQKATGRVAELTEAASGNEAAIRLSMLQGCEVFRKFLDQIQGSSRHMTSAAKETRELLGSANQLCEKLAPLQHIAFHFRLEASRLSAEDSASVLTDYDQLRIVLGHMKEAGDSQEHILLTILGKLSVATELVHRAAASFTERAVESEKNVARNLAELSVVPRDFLRVQNKADALGTLLSNGIRETVKALQGHDAIRQRLEHILGSLAGVRQGQGKEEPGHALLLQRHQAKSVLDQIVETGSQIEQKLKSVIGSAQGIAGDDPNSMLADDEVTRFETAADRIASLSTEMDGLLGGEAKIGNLILAQIVPVRELLIANDDELKALARSMRSMKLLALNVLASAHKMPLARGIGALGTMTSDAAEGVLSLERELTERFAGLGESLQSQAAVITTQVQGVESCQVGLLEHRPNEAFRNSRRTQYVEVTRLSQEARQLQQKTEVLLQSLKFVDQGTALLGDLDGTINLLLGLYPESKTPFDLEAASLGYTMKQQHDAHAAMSGDGNQDSGPVPEPSAGQELGDNVELF